MNNYESYDRYDPCDGYASCNHNQAGMHATITTTTAFTITLSPSALLL